jgi:CBS domain-containing protein
MTTVRQLLDQKPQDVWSVAPAASLWDVLQLMDEHDIGAVVVLDEGSITGIFSERDFARYAARNKKISLELPVSVLMTSQVVSIRPDQLLDECMALMTEKNIRHLPVLDQGQLIGLVSIRDVVKEIVSQRDTTIHSLENYIMGREFA